MPFNVRQEGVRNLETVQSTNRGLLERALRMRVVSYLAEKKANLLTQTIFEIDRSKAELRSHSRVLEEDREIIERQRAVLAARTAALEEVQRTLEQRVHKRTEELERANAALREEAALRERVQAEREQINERYLRAQRLELVGRLTGGVAHDFNNLLTVIMGHGELARATLGRSEVSEVSDDLDAVIEATRRGARLTRQLLAFARKQSRSTTVIEPARVVDEFAQLLKRVLGEGVQLELSSEPAIGNLRLGASELEQIILNLVVNARDAMRNGGRISIGLRSVVRAEPARAPHGRCVEIAVHDTGEGMTEEVKQHAFDAFFTTKPAGVGTGLGLATVEAIVNSAEGTVEFESTLGAGSTFRVFFPAVAEASEVRAEAQDWAALPRGTENLLVADDDESVRSVLRQMLQALGYRVLTADRTASALELLGRERVDLLLVDAALFGSEAPLGEIGLRWPQVRVLFMSGRGQPPQNVDGRALPCVEKPLELAKLASSVREALGPQETPVRARR